MNKLCYNNSMTKSEFNKIYNSLVPREDIGNNKAFKFPQFYNAVYLRENCKFLYNYFNNLYGDDYGEKIIRYLTDGTFTLTNPSQFTNRNMTYVEDVLWITQKIPLDINRITFLNVMGDLISSVYNCSRHERHIFIPDVLILLATLYKRIIYNIRREDNHKRFPNMREKVRYLKEVLNVFLKALSTDKDDYENLVTLGIVDKDTFNLIISNKGGVRSGGYINVTAISYRDYLNFMKLFLKTYKSYQRSRTMNVCKLAYYIHPTVSLHSIIDKTLAEYLDVSILLVHSGTKDVYFGSNIDFTDSKYEECLDKIIKYTKTDKSKEDIYKFIQKTIEDNIDFVRDRIDYEQLSLYKFIKKINLKVDKPFVLFNSREYENLFSDKRSEVIIDYAKVHDDLLSFEEELDKIAQIYNDAQAINQARLSIFKGINYTDCRCNVKLRNVSKNLIPFVFNRLVDETNFLRNSFSVNFTFDIENKVN